MSLSSKVRQRIAVLTVVTLAVMALAATPFLGQAQDATPAPSEAELLETGEEIYSSVCLACHQPDGKGIPGIYYPLAGNPLVTADDPTYVISTVLNGRGGMPRFNGIYTDTEIAAVLTFIRQEWDNDAGPVDPAQVEAIRHQTQAELEAAIPTPEGQLPSGRSDRSAAEASPVATPTS